MISWTAAAAAAWKHLKYLLLFLEFNFVFKATVNLPLIQVWFSIVVLLFGDLGRREEGLLVLLVAPWSVTVSPFDEPMEDKVEVRLGHGVEHLLVPRLPREGLFGTHKVRIWHHIFHLLRVEMVMATLPLVVLDVEVINHVLGRHPHLVLGRRQRQRFLDQLQWVEVALIKGVTTARQIIYTEKSES